MSTGGWVGWVTLVMLVSLTTSNPFYLALVLLSVILVGVVAPRTETAAFSFRSLLTFGLVLFGASILIACINGGVGEHVLFTLPSPEFPWWIGGLSLGGPVTLEGITWSVIRGLSILCVFLAFMVFNGAVSPLKVLRMTPAALFHAGLVVTIGLTLLPSTVQDVRRIREMQALRGHRQTWRQLPGLVVPSVLGGLERSMRLAEAMEARGFAASSPVVGWPRWAGLAATPLLLLATWAWFYVDPLKPMALPAAALGVAGLVLWGRAASGARVTTRFRTEEVALLDAILSRASFGLALLVLASSMGSWVDMDYNVFEGLEMPPFEVAGAVLALSCCWPALRIVFARRPEDAPASASAPAARERLA